MCKRLDVGAMLTFPGVPKWQLLGNFARTYVSAKPVTMKCAPQPAMEALEHTPVLSK